MLQERLTAASFFLDYLSYKLEAQQSLNKEKVSAPPDDVFCLILSSHSCLSVSTARFCQQTELSPSTASDSEGTRLSELQQHRCRKMLLTQDHCGVSCQNQHEDLKKQYYDLQDQHQAQGDDHNRQLDEHRDRYGKLQQIKEQEVTQLKGGLEQGHE